MARSLEILNTDIINDTQSVGSDAANISDILGQIARKRTFLVSDNRGIYTPLATGTLFGSNPWRNEGIDFNDTSGQSQFSGALKKIRHKISDQQGVTLELDSIENIGTLLDFSVESNDSTTYVGFQVSGAQTIGTQTINLSGGVGEIPVNALISFGNSLVPRYQIMAVDGSNPTAQVTIDRPLEISLADLETCRISVPSTTTIAGEIKRTLQTVGLNDRLGSSFDELITDDTNNSRFIYLNIIVEENVSLANHIGKLLEIGFLFLTVSQNGIIDLVRGLAYDGSQITGSDLDKFGITDNELISPITMELDDNKLLFAYNLLYIDGSAVNFITDTAESGYINEYQNTRTWTPIPQNGNLPRQYKYLYSSQAHAQFIGDLMLTYYQAPRLRLTCKMKGFRSGDVNTKLQLQLVQEYYITMRLNSKSNFVNQPARVIAFNKDLDNQIYSSVTFEFCNYLSPNLPINDSVPTNVVTKATYNINTGFASVIDNISDSSILRIIVYNSIRQQLFIRSFSNVNGLTTNGNETESYFQLTGLDNGATYFYRAQTVVGSLSSPLTDFIEFVPDIQDGRVGFAQVGIYNVGVTN